MLAKVAAAAMFCAFLLPNDYCIAAPAVPSSVKIGQPSPETAMRHYLECWLQSNSKGMWRFLSKDTKKALPLAKFQKNAASSNKEMVRLTRILWVRRLRENSTPTVVYVSYQVEARITQKKADKLHKRHPDAKPGLFVFPPTTRRMVLEDGRWLIQVYPAKA